MAFDEGTHGDGVGEAYGVQGIVKCHCEYGNSWSVRAFCMGCGRLCGNRDNNALWALYNHIEKLHCTAGMELALVYDG